MFRLVKAERAAIERDLGGAHPGTRGLREALPGGLDLRRLSAQIRSSRLASRFLACIVVLFPEGAATKRYRKDSKKHHKACRASCCA